MVSQRGNPQVDIVTGNLIVSTSCSLEAKASHENIQEGDSRPGQGRVGSRGIPYDFFCGVRILKLTLCSAGRSFSTTISLPIDIDFASSS